MQAALIRRRRSGIALAIAAERRIVDAGLLAVGARVGRIGLDAEIVVLAEIAESARAGAGAALSVVVGVLADLVIAIDAWRGVAGGECGSRQGDGGDEARGSDE